MAAGQQVSRVAVTTRPNEKNGVVYTKPWVVDLILDLVGYTPDLPLHLKIIVEPSAGDGSFLLRAVDRLITSCQRHAVDLRSCENSIMAFELDPSSAERARQSVATLLVERGVPQAESRTLAETWVKCADYLLDSWHLFGRADFVVGNPPYIRLEDMDSGGAIYRASYPTMRGRADIYVAFFEAALKQLAEGGKCGFICADRWMFNQYGAELRSFITANYSVEQIIQMHHADAFEDKVSAYPAVTVISRNRQTSTIVACLDPESQSLGSQDLVRELSVGYGSGSAVGASKIERWFTGDAPWPLINPNKLALLRRLETAFPTIEESGARVGIGVATGADRVFITKDESLVERDRLLPMAMASDVRSGGLRWSGHYLVNPWTNSGLVDLSRFPRLQRYFESHGATLRGRHVGKGRPEAWFRTIDRVTTRLLTDSKLYLPDMSDRIEPVLDEGSTYPHHNLYFITPGPWDPRVLGGLLMSDVVRFIVEAYSVRMRGGFLRLQAQYLRRIRLPWPSEISTAAAAELSNAFDARDCLAASRAANEVFGISIEEVDLLD